MSEDKKEHFLISYQHDTGSLLLVQDFLRQFCGESTWDATTATLQLHSFPLEIVHWTAAAVKLHSNWIEMALEWHRMGLGCILGPQDWICTFSKDLFNFRGNSFATRGKPSRYIKFSESWEAWNLNTLRRSMMVFKHSKRSHMVPGVRVTK